MSTIAERPRFADHTCWDQPDWDGCMRDDCSGCDEAAKHPCNFCGYGHLFTTHNPLAHFENDDPIAVALGDEDAWCDRFNPKWPYVEGNVA